MTIEDDVAPDVLFEARCNREKARSGKEIWSDLRLRMQVDRHPAALRVSMIAIQLEDRGDVDLVPMVIGNFLRLSEVELRAGSISRLCEDVARASKLVRKTADSAVFRLGGANEEDFRSARAKAFIDEVASLNEALGEAALALRCAEEIAKHLRHLSSGNKRTGLDAALIGSPLKILADQLAQIWLSCGSTLDGGRRGDGLDEVLARVVDHVVGTEDRGPRKWLSELMTEVRDRHMKN